MNTPRKKSVWVLAVAGVSYDDTFNCPSPSVVVKAVGTYRNCLEALKNSIREEASVFWEGTSNFEECLQSEIDEVMASRKDYGPSIREWEMRHNSHTIGWRLQKIAQK